MQGGLEGLTTGGCDPGGSEGGAKTSEEVVYAVIKKKK